MSNVVFQGNPFFTQIKRQLLSVLSIKVKIVFCYQRGAIIKKFSTIVEVKIIIVFFKRQNCLHCRGNWHDIGMSQDIIIHNRTVSAVVSNVVSQGTPFFTQIKRQLLFALSIKVKIVFCYQRDAIIKKFSTIVDMIIIIFF